MDMYDLLSVGCIKTTESKLYVESKNISKMMKG